jgi:hypothetical protein
MKPNNPPNKSAGFAHGANSRIQHETEQSAEQVGGIRPRRKFAVCGLSRTR